MNVKKILLLTLVTNNLLIGTIASRTNQYEQTQIRGSRDLNSDEENQKQLSQSRVNAFEANQNNTNNNRTSRASRDLNPDEENQIQLNQSRVNTLQNNNNSSRNVEPQVLRLQNIELTNRNIDLQNQRLQNDLDQRQGCCEKFMICIISMDMFCLGFLIVASVVGTVVGIYYAIKNNGQEKIDVTHTNARNLISISNDNYQNSTDEFITNNMSILNYAFKTLYALLVKNNEQENTIQTNSESLVIINNENYQNSVSQFVANSMSMINYVFENFYALLMIISNKVFI